MLPKKFNKILILMFLFVTVFIFQNLSNNSLTKIERDNLFNISNYNDYILFGGEVYGKNNFQHLLKNPKIIMLNPQMNFYKEKNISNLFCNNGKKFKSLRSFYKYINQECFANKSKREWIRLKKQHNIHYVVTPSYQTLNKLKKIGSISNFNIFKIN